MTKKYISTPVSELKENQYTQEREERNKKWASRTLCALAGIAMSALVVNAGYQILYGDPKQEREKKNREMTQYYEANNIPYTEVNGRVNPVLGKLEIKSDKLNLLKSDEETSESL